MSERYPGYDVLSKHGTPSWNSPTRAVIDERLAVDPNCRRFFTEDEWMTLQAVCRRIVPQPPDRANPVPLAAMVDHKMLCNAGDGFRDARLPPMGEAWRRGLAALDAEAELRCGRRFAEVSTAEQDVLLTTMQGGKVDHALWHDVPAELFFRLRILHDIVSAYYAHPTSWNEIGFGGPASPRGYVRMNFDQRDPWEASEGRPGREAKARRENARLG